MGELAELLEENACSDIVEGKVEAKVEINNGQINNGQLQENKGSQRHDGKDIVNVKIKDDDRMKKLTPIEYLTVTGKVPALDQVQIMTIDELSARDAKQLLDAGSSKRQLFMLYGAKTIGGQHYKLLRRILNDSQPDCSDGKAVTGTGGTVDERAETVDERAETVDEDEQKCRVCGCTDDMACPGGCYWVEPDLCSRCAERMRREDVSHQPEYSSAVAAAPETVDEKAIAPTKFNIAWIEPMTVYPPKITINKQNVIRINTAAVKLAPKEYHGCGMRVGIDEDQSILAIQPEEQRGSIISKEKRGAIRLVSKQAGCRLREAGVPLPAKFDASWDDKLQAWIGQLVRDEKKHPQEPGRSYLGWESKRGR